MTLSGRTRHLLFAATLLVCGVFLWWIRLDGFIPGDEGLLGQSAERVLLGEWPHRDFDDTYTGGQAFLHAAVFRVFGVSSAHLRTLLWVLSMVFLAVFYRLCRTEDDHGAAAAVTVLALVWSLPNYFAALPSWYNLFFAVFGLAALLRFQSSDQRRYLVLAGLCGGLSITFKIVGLLFLAGATLALLFYRQRQDADDVGESPRHRSGLMGWVVGAVALATAAGFYALFRHALTPANLLYFVVPALALVGVLISEEGRPKRRAARARVQCFAGDLLALGGGAMVPLLGLLVPYALTPGGLWALWQGVFVVPSLRVDLVAYPLPTPLAFLLGVPVVLAVFFTLRNRWPAGWVLLGAAGLAVVFFGDQADVHTAVWRGVRLLVPLAILDGLWRLSRGRREASDLRVFAVLAALALFSPIQFPYARGVYFCYVAPLLILALATLWSTRRPGLGNPRAMAALALVFGLFALLWLHRSAIYAFGRRYEKRPELVEIAEPRLGLRVPLAYARGYGDLIAFIREQVPPDQPILALPDLPQLYFFAARRNPTRLLCDALTAESPSPEQYERWLGEVGLVVINRRPEFSPPISAELERAIVAAFPQKAKLEDFEVRYRTKP